MSSYSVWAPRAGNIAETAVFVAQKFSWGAAIFTFLWAAWHRHYFLALVLALGFGAVQALVLVPGVHPLLPGLISNLLALWLGWEAASLRDWLYERRGFRSLGEVRGDDDEEAELRFFAGLEPAAPSATPRPILVGTPSDLLGLFAPGGA